MTLIWHSIAGLSVRGFEVAAKLALYMLAARILGNVESGFLFLAMTWGHWAATAARLGIDRSLTRLVAAELAHEQGANARDAILKGATASIFTGCCLGLATWAAAPAVAAFVFRDPAAAEALRASAAVIPGMSIAFTLTAVLTGLQRTVLAQTLQNALWPVSMLAGLALGLRSATGLILVLAASMGLAIAVAAMAIARDRAKLRINGTSETAIDALPSLASTALPLFVVELVQVTIATLPVLVLGAFGDPEAVSVFSIAQRASMVVWVVLISLGSLAAPRFAGLHRQARWPDLRRINRQMQLAGAALGGTLCLVLAGGAEPLLSFMGPGFAIGALTLVVMAGGQFINALYATQDVLLAMTGHGAALRVLNLLQLGTILLLSPFLVWQLGALGAALATALATAQGGFGTAMIARVCVPEAGTLFAPPLPRVLRPLFARSIPMSTVP